jgi:hypothetical protein
MPQRRLKLLKHLKLLKLPKLPKHPKNLIIPPQIITMKMIPSEIF